MPRTTRVTIMFTDLVGSTELLDRLGDEVGAELLRRHFAMLRRAVTSHGGREIKSLGDGLMVTFTSSSAAAACAAAMQRGIVRHNRASGSVPLGLRIGIHAGNVVREPGGDLLGMPVVIARRLCDLGAAGQVIVSAAARPDHGRLDDLGPLPLKGVRAEVEAATLRWGEPDAVPSLVAV